MKHLIPAFANVPVLLLSSPGKGKTSAIMQAGEQLNRYVECLILSICAAEDTGGIPVVENGETKFAQPEFLKRLHQAHSNGQKSILFIDELTCCKPSLQASALTLIQSRRIHGFKLPDTTAIVAAANPPEQAADGSGLELPMSNRFCFLNFDIETEDWIQMLMNDFQNNAAFELPENWRSYIQEEKGYIAAYLKNRPGEANKLPQNKSAEGEPWPSYRSWTNAIHVAAAARSVGLDPTEFVCGCVGQGPGSEYMNWRSKLDIPDPEELLKRPTSWKVPNRDDICMATFNSVVSAVASNLTKQRWMKAWDIVGALCDAGKPDIAAIGVRYLRDLGNPKNDSGQNWEPPDKQFNKVAKFVNQDYRTK